MQFEKIGCGLLREAKQREGEWAVLVEAKGDEKAQELNIVGGGISLIRQLTI